MNIFTTGPFYDTYLLYQDENESYHSILETDGETTEWVDQYQEIREKGYLGEFSIAGGTNYKDKLYLGAVLGIQWTYDKQRILYSEIAEENAPSLLDFMNSGNTVVPEYGDQFETRAYLSSGTGYSIGGRYSFADLVYDGVYT